MLSATLYILIHAFDAPVRYGLHTVGMDAAIYLRDGLLAGPLLLLFARQCMRGTVHPAYWVFAIIIASSGRRSPWRVAVARPSTGHGVTGAPAMQKAG